MISVDRFQKSEKKNKKRERKKEKQKPPWKPTNLYRKIKKHRTMAPLRIGKSRQQFCEMRLNFEQKIKIRDERTKTAVLERRGREERMEKVWRKYVFWVNFELTSHHILVDCKRLNNNKLFLFFLRIQEFKAKMMRDSMSSLKPELTWIRLERYRERKTLWSRIRGCGWLK